MRRGSIVALLGIGLVAGGVATAVAVIPTWLPVEASRAGRPHDFLFWVVIAICIAIFAVVAAVMVYSIVKFKAAPDDLEDGPSDPRPHRARDHVDGDSARDRHGDRDRQRDRPDPERRARRESVPHQRHRAAVLVRRSAIPKRATRRVPCCSCRSTARSCSTCARSTSSTPCSCRSSRSRRTSSPASSRT